MHHLGLLLLVVHELLVDAFERDELSREFVHAEADLPEGATSEHLTCSVKLRDEFCSPENK